jgi:hypothetical protein
MALLLKTGSDSFWQATFLDPPKSNTSTCGKEFTTLRLMGTTWSHCSANLMQMATLLEHVAVFKSYDLKPANDDSL